MAGSQYAPSGGAGALEGRSEFSLFLPANRASRRSSRSAARYNTFDSNIFHKRFDVRLPEYNREIISLIMRITGAEKGIRVPAEDLALLIQMIVYQFENERKKTLCPPRWSSDRILLGQAALPNPSMGCWRYPTAYSTRAR
jgi:hypothetical protein